MTLYIQYNNYSLNETDVNVTHKLNDIFKSEYIQDKIKELLFKIIPQLIEASGKIIKLCFNFILKVSKEYLNRIKNKEFKLTNIKSLITDLFNEIYKIINTLFEQKKAIIVMKTEPIQKLAISNLEIFNILEEFSQKESFKIEINDLEKINNICEYSKVKIFAIETENNYTCLPMSDENNDIKSFEVIKTTMFYKQKYQVTDEQFDELIDICKDFVNNKLNNLVANKQDFSYKNFKTLPGLILLFKYYEPKDLKKIDYHGAHLPKDIEIPFSNIHSKMDKNVYFLNLLSITIHEVLHENDYRQDDMSGNLTNKDIERLMHWITKTYENQKIVSLQKIKKDMKSEWLYKDELINYLLAIAEKHQFINFIPPDFKNIKILTNKNSKEIAQKDIHDILPTENASVLSDHSFLFINDINNYNFIMKEILNAIKNNMSYEDFEKKISNTLLIKKYQTQIKNLSFDYAKQIVTDRKKLNTEKLSKINTQKLINDYQENIYKKLFTLIQQNILMIYRRQVRLKNKQKTPS